jgi:hypothetical protein
MKLTTLLSTITSLALMLVAQAADFGSVPDPYTGNWSGTLVTPEKTQPLHATIIAYKDSFEVTFRSEPNPRAEAIIILNGKVSQNKLVLEPAQNTVAAEATARQTGDVSTKSPVWQGQVEGVELKGTVAGREKGTFSLRKVPFTPSPTVGQKAPPGSTVLFDGNQLTAWESKQAPADPIQWVVTEAKTLEVVSQRDGKKSKQDLKTKELYGDYRLHVEFKLAYKPEATGQGRSNSGVIHHGVYETQILDSFGLYGRDNECGGIYKTREPDSNAGYPAGLWQTYDFEVKAPRFDAQGNKTSDARMTVRLNGIVVHQDVAVPKPTAGGKESARGPIVLQDHGNPVQFRNIWVVKLD